MINCKYIIGPNMHVNTDFLSSVKVVVVWEAGKFIWSIDWLIFGLIVITQLLIAIIKQIDLFNFQVHSFFNKL